MNTLTGKIVSVESSRQMSMVDIDVQGDVFTAIVLDTPDSAPYLKNRTAVAVLFKETEVSIGKNLSGLISLRNRFKATVKRLEESSLLTKVFLQYKNKEVIAVIASRSAKAMQLAEGDGVEWLVKTNEISLRAEE